MMHDFVGGGGTSLFIMTKMEGYLTFYIGGLANMFPLDIGYLYNFLTMLMNNKHSNVIHVCISLFRLFLAGLCRPLF